MFRHKSMARVLLTMAAIGLGNTMSASGSPKNPMPDSFVYLRDVDPTIQQDMRYAGRNNFTRRPVPGYDAPECVLVREAAEALRAVQAKLKTMGYSLKVYDCYRPAQAVAAFVEWSSELDDPIAKQSHYPNLSKSDLFPKYIATRSGHSRGATMDLTIIPIGSEPSPVTDGSSKAEPCTESDPSDNSVDMGTAFDCFDLKANTITMGLTPLEAQNRQLLLDVMARHSFQNYPKEFWHFTFQPEPYPDTYFDFPILPRPGNSSEPTEDS